MGLFSETCIRCGATMPRAGHGAIPTCSRCASLLLDKARADAEQPRSCPVDGAAMDKQLVHGLVLDRCPACGGVWLDGGELELLERSITDAPDALLASTVVLGMTRR